MPGHKTLSDEVLMELPEAGAMTAPTMFVCTYKAGLKNIGVGFLQLTEQVVNRINSDNDEVRRGGTRTPESASLLALNSNFGHAAQIGYERLMKIPKPAPDTSSSRIPSRTRPRKLQGDGTCFNSAIEPTVRVENADLPRGKIYHMKCFPSTGETQVPGVLFEDKRDGRLALRAFVDYLNSIGAGAVGEDGVPREITIDGEMPSMLNYKYRLNRRSPRILVNLGLLADYLCLLGRVGVSVSKPPTPEQVESFVGWPSLVLPPYLVRETKAPANDVKVSFCMRVDDNECPRINIFQGGKVNILGAKTSVVVYAIYAFFVQMFTENWIMLVGLLPKKDSEMRSDRARAAAAPAPAPPALAIPDNEMADYLESMYDEMPETEEVTAPNVELAEALGDIMADLDEWCDDDEEF